MPTAAPPTTKNSRESRIERASLPPSFKPLCGAAEPSKVLRGRVRVRPSLPLASPAVSFGPALLSIFVSERTKRQKIPPSDADEITLGYRVATSKYDSEVLNEVLFSFSFGE